MEPVSAGILASSAATAGTVSYGIAPALLAGAVGLQAIGAVSQANSNAAALGGQAQAADYNAAVSRQQAGQALSVSTANQIEQNRKARRVLGMQRAGAAQAGVGMGGSTGDLLERSETLAELDQLNLAYEGMLKARSFTTQAELDTFNASAYRAQAKSVKRAGILGAAGAVALGGYEFSKMKTPTPKSTVRMSSTPFAGSYGWGNT